MGSEAKLTELTFQLLVESTPNSIVLVNKDGNIVYLNSQTEKLFGYQRSELIGQPVEILIPNRFREHHPGFIATFFSMPSVRAMGAGRELYALKQDGTEFPIEIGLNPVITVDGSLVLASIIDITERKKAHERFRLVVDSAPNAMVLINDQGTITLVNKETQHLFGYTDKELVGSKVEMLIPHRFKKHHPTSRNLFFNKPQNRSMGIGRDLFAQRKDGREIPVEIGLNPIETEKGTMVLASIIDITQRKIQEETIKKQSELEVKNRELEQFAFIASHDLQEPLRTVSNYARILEEDYIDNLDEAALKYLQTIQRATNRMSTLVKGLLNFSRVGRDKKLAEVNCSKVVEDTLVDLYSAIKESQAKVEVGELPILQAYETQLHQLFQNLISNALKFRNTSTPPIIKITSEKIHDKWRFSIEDNGIGIAEKDFDRIFQIYQRLHKQSQYDGYGLGLPNCKKIAELHGGEIWVESILGKGTTFYFTISDLREE